MKLKQFRILINNDVIKVQQYDDEFDNEWFSLNYEGNCYDLPTVITLEEAKTYLKDKGIAEVEVVERKTYKITL